MQQEVNSRLRKPVSQDRSIGTFGFFFAFFLPAVLFRQVAQQLLGASLQDASSGHRFLSSDDGEKRYVSGWCGGGKERKRRVFGDVKLRRTGG